MVKGITFDSCNGKWRYRRTEDAVQKTILASHNKEDCIKRKMLDENIIQMYDSSNDKTYIISMGVLGTEKEETSNNIKDVHEELITICISDLHITDKNMLFKSLLNTIEKTLNFVKVCKPNRVNINLIGDSLQGKGVYRNDSNELLLVDVKDQIKVLISFLNEELLQKLTEFVNKENININILDGQHDMSCGYLISDSLVDKLNLLGYKTYNHLSEAVVNFSECNENKYMVYLTHGTGYSRYATKSPAFINNVKDRIFNLQKDFNCDIRRCVSGHSHWVEVNYENPVAFFWDNTGGFQGNRRRELGFGSRPTGLLVYKGSNPSNPYIIRPDDDIFKSDIYSNDFIVSNLKEMTKYLELAGKLTCFETKGITNFL